MQLHCKMKSHPNHCTFLLFALSAILFGFSQINLSNCMFCSVWEIPSLHTYMGTGVEVHWLLLLVLLSNLRNFLVENINSLYHKEYHCYLHRHMSSRITTAWKCTVVCRIGLRLWCVCTWSVIMQFAVFQWWNISTHNFWYMYPYSWNRVCIPWCSMVVLYFWSPWTTLILHVHSLVLFEINLFVVTCSLVRATLTSTNATVLLVTGTPTNFIATRTGLQTAETSWAAPSSNTPPVGGYEVFFESESGVWTSGGSVAAPQTSLNLSSLEPNISYTAFVVAFGGDLPSRHSNTANLSAGKIWSRWHSLCFISTRWLK